MEAAMEIEIEPRSSLERDLLDRDREGQLYLETRRQRALVNLLDNNRTSFLSTITPPSTNPPSAASSLFQEPLATPANTDATARPSIPNTPAQSAEAAASATNTTPSNSLAAKPSIQNIIPAIKKKTRQRSSSGRGRTLVPEPEDRPVVPISPSSLEYQLTANLLKFHHAPPSSSETRSRSRSRSKPRPHKSRQNATLINDARIDVNAFTMTNRVGHGRIRGITDEQETLEDDLEEKTATSTPAAELTPATLWGSIPSSPTSAFEPPSPLSPSSVEQHRPIALINTSLPSLPPSPPLPPLPPKSPRSLIAHYFPGSLPPPPARCRILPTRKDHVLAPKPFKTPTFGPAFTRTGAVAPPIPSPSSSIQFITALPSPTIVDDTMSFSSPSPSISALGPTLSMTSKHQHQQQGPRVPSELDLSISTSARARSHYLQQQPPQPQSPPLPLHSNNSNISAEGGRDLASISSSPFNFSFSNLADSELFSGADFNNMTSTTTTATTTVTTSVLPIYPRDLMPITSATMSGSSSSGNGNSSSGGPQKIKAAVPYVREPIPGREDPLPLTIHNSNNLSELPTTCSSTNTSRDLEMVLEEITGRIYTNRTSTGPWSAPLPSCYYHNWAEDSLMDNHDSNEDEKSLPPIRRERGSRYWVFRTADGEIVPGPYLFLLGHLCPVLWWIGSVYPSIEHPDHQRRQHHHHHHHSYSHHPKQQDRAINLSRPGKNSGTSIGSQRRLSSDEPTTTSPAQTGAEDLAENPVIQWLQRQLRAAGVRIASITTTVRSSSPSSSLTMRQQQTDPEQMATLQVVRISQEDPDRGLDSDGAGLTGRHLNNSSLIHVPARLLFPPHTFATATDAAHSNQVATTMTTTPTTTTAAMAESALDTHGPWSAEDNASYLFELRMARDRKLLRYELDLSWRRINLVWSLGSFVLAITITAIVLSAT